MISKRAALLGAGMALLLGVLFLMRSGPEEGIRRQTEKVRELISKGPGESDLEGLGKARKISAFFAENFEVDAPQFDFSSRDRQAVAGFVHRYRSGQRAIVARLIDHEIGLDPESTHATSHLTAQFVTGLGDLTGTETYRFQINWREEAGEWKMDYVRLLEIVEAP